MLRGVLASRLRSLINSIVLILVSLAGIGAVLFGGSPALAFEKAANATPTPPGVKDPVGSPETYQTLPSHDLLTEIYWTAENHGDTLYTKEVAEDNRFLSQDIPTAEGIYSNPSRRCNSVTVSGHISGEDREQVLQAARIDNNYVGLKFARHERPLVRLPNLGVVATLNSPDFIAMAAGDLDKLPDADGINHDEVVVAYEDNLVGRTTDVDLAVVNYTSEPAIVTELPHVLKANMPFLSESNTLKPRVDDQPFAVAVGSFDGSGENEIALAAIDSENSLVRLQIYRYLRDSLTTTPKLQIVSDTSYDFTTKIGDFSVLMATISLVAGDFTGDGKKDELLLALNSRFVAGSGRMSRTYTDVGKNFLQVIETDANLKPGLRGFLAFNQQKLGGSTTETRIKAVPGLFLFNNQRSDLYRRQVAVAFNERTDYSGTTTKVKVQVFSISEDLNTITPLANKAPLELTSNKARYIGAGFDLAAGAFAVNGRLESPGWSLAVSQPMLDGNNATTRVSLIAVSPTGLTLSDSTQFSSVCGCGADNDLRWALTAYDFRGKSVFFGAPIHFVINKLITTDFVLEEPPKHTYWDPNLEKVINVSRFSTIATSLKTKKGTSFEGQSKDTSSFSIGASLELSASTTIQGGFPIIGKGKVSLEVENKTAYNYETNQESYNSDYAERSVSEDAAALNADLLKGRIETLDVWRYRVLGVSVTDENNKQANAFYDVVLPRPESKSFTGSSTDLAWYQPYHENGNILSYPSPNGDTFNPSDIGTYQVPCSGTGGNCKKGTMTVSGPMIPAQDKFINQNSESFSLDYQHKGVSSDTFMYQHKLDYSLDVKAGFEVEALTVKDTGSVKVGFTEGGSWGSLKTNQNTTTKETGITVSLTPINSLNSYGFYPIFYTTLDGTIKVAHATDPLASDLGRHFWMNFYGKTPDPALNLPARFTNVGDDWIPNTDISRKKIRGFFVLSKDKDPLNGQYIILKRAPVAGDKVRLSAEVYNYSTGVEFKDCLVSFSAVKYDALTGAESGPGIPIGKTHVSLSPRAHTPAQIEWDTTGFAPAAGKESQAYRIYVELNYDHAIDEIYPPEDPNKRYAPDLPVGVDPGQNDQGFGETTVVANRPEFTQTSRPPVHLYLGSEPLAVQGPSGLSTEDLLEPVGYPIQMQAQVCASGYTRDLVDLLVFDGPSANGQVIAWKQIFVPDGRCYPVKFQWTPRVAGNHTLVAEVLQDDDDPAPGNNQASLEVKVLGR